MGFQITNFQMSAFNTLARQDSGQVFTNEQIQIIKQCKPGDKITFDDIKCKGMEGMIRNLPSLSIEIK
jgi:hypothetical protein